MEISPITTIGDILYIAYMFTSWSVIFLLAFIFLVTTNVYWIFSEMKRTTAPTGERIKFVICQIIFAVGIFGVLFFLCGAFSSAGSKSNKNKKK